MTISLAGGTPRTGLWCDRCLTPAGFDLDILSLSDDGVSVIKIVRECARCDYDERADG